MSNPKIEIAVELFVLLWFIAVAAFEIGLIAGIVCRLLSRYCS